MHNSLVTVQYFLGVLFTPGTNLGELQQVLADAFGSLEDPSEIYPFNHTDYYQPEMGDTLHRIFFSVTKLAPSWDLALFKERAIQVEDAFYKMGGKRLVNIDPGYLDPVKFVLASTKPGGHKIPLSAKMHADMVLDYFKGNFRAFDWTFPDFKSGLYFPYFKLLREKYLARLPKG